MPRLVTIGENRIQKKRRHFVEIKKKRLFLIFIYTAMCVNILGELYFFLFFEEKKTT